MKSMSAIGTEKMKQDFEVFYKEYKEQLSIMTERDKLYYAYVGGSVDTMSNVSKYLSEHSK